MNLKFPILPPQTPLAAPTRPQRISRHTHTHTHRHARRTIPQHPRSTVFKHSFDPRRPSCIPSTPANAQPRLFPRLHHICATNYSFADSRQRYRQGLERIPTGPSALDAHANRNYNHHALPRLAPLLPLSLSLRFRPEGAQFAAGEGVAIPVARCGAVRCGLLCWAGLRWALKSHRVISLYAGARRGGLDGVGMLKKETKAEGHGRGSLGCRRRASFREALCDDNLGSRLFIDRFQV